MKEIESSVIVPIFQDQNIFNIFLDSLKNTIHSNSQIIFVNDGSGELIKLQIEKLFKNQVIPNVFVEYIEHEHPQGTVTSINKALKRAQGKYIFFLDSDIILNEGWQKSMIETFSLRKEIGIVGAVLIYPQTGGIQHCGLAFSYDIGRHLFLNADPTDIPTNIFSVQSVVFALCGIKKEVIDRVGCLDEMYFNGYEDLDFQMRAIKEGFDIVVNPAIKSYHWERSNGIHRLFNRKNNLGRYWRKWGSQIQPDLWEFLIENLKRHLALKKNSMPNLFVGIDLAEVRSDANTFWVKVHALNTIIIKEVYDYSNKINQDGPIWLLQILNKDILQTSKRLLILVDNFVRLLENKYWHELRKLIRKDDLIIDLYGNVTELSRIIKASWPGSKFR